MRGQMRPSGRRAPPCSFISLGASKALDASGVALKKLFIDGEELSISQGDCFKIKQKGERCLKADDDSELRFICIQACKGSLKNFTASDAVVSQDGKKPSWL